MNNKRKLKSVTKPDLDLAYREITPSNLYSSFQSPYPSNRVFSTPYTLLSLLPKTLFEEFQTQISFYWFSILIFFSFYLNIRESSLKWYILITVLLLLLPPIARNFNLMLNRKRSDLLINKKEANLWKPFQFSSVTCESLQVGDVVLVSMFEEVPADIVLLACKEGTKVQIMMNQNLGKEEVVEKKTLDNFRIGRELDHEEIFANLKKIERMSVLAPSKSFDKFKAKIRFKGNPKTYTADLEQFVIGGSRVVGNEWVLGVVVYTGFDTKMWINSGMVSGSKHSKLGMRVNVLHFIHFFVIVGFVFVTEVLKGVYQNEFEFGVGESVMWNVVFYGNLISSSMVLTMKIAKIISAAVIQFRTKDIKISYEILQELGKVEYIVAEKNELLGGEKIKLTAFGVGDKVFYKEIDYFDGKPKEKYKIINQNSSIELLTEYQRFEDLEKLVKSDNIPGNLQDFLFCVFFTSQKIKDACIQLRKEDKITQKRIKSLGISVQHQTFQDISLKFNDVLYNYTLLGEYSDDTNNYILVQSDLGTYLLFAKFNINTIKTLPGGEDFANSFKIDFNSDFKGLFYACKSFSPEAGETFSFDISLAQKSVLNSEGKLKKIFEQRSKDLNFLGFLGFEHKKLEKVSKTLKKLNEVGIKTWMVSGDSCENSILACYSSQLFSKEIKINSLEDLETVDESIISLNRILKTEANTHSRNECCVENSASILKPLRKRNTIRHMSQVNPNPNIPSTMRTVNMETNFVKLLKHKSLKASLEFKLPKLENINLVQYNLLVDSKSLNTILSAKESRRLFVIVLFLAKSVCFYGLTPDQKQSVVLILKKNFSFAPTVMALSGSNTNSMMLNEANISVKVQNSLKKWQDFDTQVTIPDFSKVTEIILVHGHYSYVRLARILHGSVCREMMVCIILFLYQFQSGFSSAYVLDIDLFVIFEVFLTLFPLLLTGIFDKDVTEKVAKNSSAVYSTGYFNFLSSNKRLAFYSFMGVLQGVIIYVFVFFGFGSVVNAKGFSEDSEVLGTLCFILMSLCFVQKIFVSNQSFYFPTIVSPILAVGFIFLCVGFTMTGQLSGYSNSKEILLGQGRFWVLVTTLPSLSCACFFVCSLGYSRIFTLKFRNRLDMFKDCLEKVYKDTDTWKETPKISSFKIEKKSLKFRSAYQELEYQTQLSSGFTKVLRILFGLISFIMTVYLVLIYTEMIESIKYQQYVAVPVVISFIFLVLSFSTVINCEKLIFLFFLFIQIIFIVNSVINSSFTILRYPILEVLFSICFNLRWKLTLMQTVLTFIVSVFIFTYEIIAFELSVAGITTAYCIMLNLGISVLCLIITYIMDYSRRTEYTFVEKAKKQFAKSNEILGYLLPEFVKKRVNDGVRYIAEEKGVVTIVFCDICEFDRIVEEYSSSEIVSLLDEFFSRIDKICETVGVAKIETVGKTYMACSGLSDFDYDLNSCFTEIPHPRRAIEMAFAVLQESEKTLLKSGKSLQMKIGIHSGPVIAGVVGFHKPQFSLVGDTVNTASRMASTLESYNKIQISMETYKLLEDFSGLYFINNYPVVKGKGMMRTLLVEPARKSTENLIGERKETTESTASASVNHFKTVNDGKNKTHSTILEDRKLLKEFQCHLSFREKIVQMLCVETQGEKEFQEIIHKNSLLMQQFGLVTAAVVNLGLIILASIEVSFEMTYFSDARLSIICVEEALTVVFLYYLKRVHKLRTTAYLLNSLYWSEVIIFFVLEFFYDNNFTIEMLFFYFRFLLLNFCTGLFFFRSVISNISLITIMILKIFYFSSAPEDYFFAIFFVICILCTTYDRESSLRADHIIRHIFNEENEKTEQLLTQMLPSRALKNLQEEVIETDKLNVVTIMYADIVGFTSWSAQRSPSEVIGMLSELFTKFDKMCVEFGVYKVYTIGDCYVAMGYNEGNKRNPAAEAKQMTLFAFCLVKLIQEVSESIGGGLDMRIGIHTGNIIGGINGTGIIRYDIYGKDVMIANKMESNGVPGRITVSESTKELLEGFASREFSFEFLKDVKAWDVSVGAYLITKYE